MSQKTIINPSYDGLAEWIATLPDRFDHEGEVLNDKRNVIKRWVIDGMPVVVKRFRRPSWPQRVVYTFFRKSKAERAYQYGMELRRRGFDTACSIAYIEHRSGMLIDYCYYLCENDDAPAIEREIKNVAVPNKSLLEDFARYAWQLHQHGILHHDLNRSNVLYRKGDDGHYHFSLIDNNRMTFYPEGTLPPLNECMENLTRFTGDMEIFRTVAVAYCQARQLGDDMVSQLMAVKERHDIRRKKRKAFLKKLKTRH